MTHGNYCNWRQTTALICTILIAQGSMPLFSQQPASGQAPAAASVPGAPAAQETPKLKSADQLDSAVAPIALYPDPLLAQVLAASTYPLEIVQAARWLKKNPKLAGEELTKASAKQPWDASVQALVGFPEALKLLDENIQWTTDLGNAFLDQQSQVMEAVQRMRAKAKQGGKLQSTKEQKVEVKTIEQKTVIEIIPADPQVIYVPSYNPTVVYGAPPVYAYPPMYYPPVGAYAATAAVSFGVGVMMGAMWSGGGYGWGCGWGNNNITINNNFQQRNGYNNVNTGNRNNVNGGNRANVKGGNSWQHNPQHRGAVPYGNRNTAQQFGGASRGSSGRTERFDQSGRARDSQGDRGSNRSPQASTRDAGGNRGQSGVGGGQDRVGNRSIGSDSGRSSAFSGSDSRSRTQAASNRGSSSSRQSSGMSSSRSSGGFSGGGGGGRSSGGGSRSRSGGGGRRR